MFTAEKQRQQRDHTCLPLLSLFLCGDLFKMSGGQAIMPAA
jgi:hypothetical protein